jgi:hypothetical protein
MRNQLFGKLQLHGKPLRAAVLESVMDLGVYGEKLNCFTIMNREGTQRLTEWSPSRFFNSNKPNHPFALILLNQPLNWTAFEKIFRSGAAISTLTLLR